MLGCNADVLDTVGTVVGTGKGVVIEYLGGENNGESCPPASLELREDWMGELADQEVQFSKLVLPGVHHHGIIGVPRAGIFYYFVKYEIFQRVSAATWECCLAARSWTGLSVRV